jgi:hypothetical protein
MNVVFAIGVVLLLAGTFAGTLLVFPAMWQGFRDQWVRYPPERRRIGLIGASITAVALVVEAALVIAAPWGPNSIVYVIGIGNGTLMVLLMAAVAVQAVQETRRAKRRRSLRR